VTTLLIAALFVSIATIGYVTATSKSVDTELYPFVEIGDMVYVEYVGYFPTHPGGWIFDTNKRSIGTDDSLIKSLYFVEREPADYTPLNLSAGMSKNYLKTFVDGVVGMMVTQTKGIYIAEKDGYPLVADNFAIFPIIQIAPVIQNITLSEFRSAYESNPVNGMLLKHYFWEWDVRVKTVIGDKVVMQSEPYIGQIISSYGDPSSDQRDGWYQKVISINTSADGGAGRIRVQNFIAEQDIFQRKGADFDGRLFTLIDVDTSRGEFSVAYNSENYVGELASRPLFFEITVTKVLKKH
jgi:FKBP-type peptidyl-prolyl cis-trans isomerase 2